MRKRDLILLGIIAVLLICGFFLLRLVVAQKQAMGQMSTYNSQLAAAPRVWKDEANRWRSEAEATALEARTLRELVRAGDPKLNTLVKEFDGLKRTLKNLESYQSVKGETRMSVVVPIIRVDSTASRFEWSDKWSTISGTVLGDSAALEYEVRDSIDLVQYWDRTWFLGRKMYHSEIISHNPNTKVYQAQVIQKKKVGFIGRLLGH